MERSNKTPKLKLNKELKRKFKVFLEYHPPKRVNRNLREIFMNYASHAVQTVPGNMEEIIWDMICLMELFDLAEDETKDWPGR